MHKFVCPTLAASILAAASTVAGAADLPSRRAPPVFAPPPIPVFTWTGFYVGANAGYAFGDNNNNDGNADYIRLNKGSVPGSRGTAGTVTFNNNNNNNGRRDGFTGGGQIGFNYQLGSGVGLPVLGNLGGLGGIGGGGIVIGAEADAQYLGIGNNNNGFNGNGTFSPAGGNPGNYGNAFVPVPGKPRTTIIVNGAQQSRRDNFFGTVRGRLGYTFDRVLVFGTGGFAYSDHATGYTFGGGVEYAITNNVSVRAEYLRVNLGGNGNNSTNLNSIAYTANGPNTADVVRLNTTNRISDRERFNVVRAAINYKFDVFNPIAPVVARY